MELSDFTNGWIFGDRQHSTALGIALRISSIGRTAEIFPAFGLIFQPEGGILRDLTAVISFDDVKREIYPAGQPA